MKNTVVYYSSSYEPLLIFGKTKRLNPSNNPAERIEHLIDL